MQTILDQKFILSANQEPTAKNFKWDSLSTIMWNMHKETPCPFKVGQWVEAK